MGGSWRRAAMMIIRAAGNGFGGISTSPTSFASLPGAAGRPFAAVWQPRFTLPANGAG
jgi:hypothetical protein